VKGVYQRGKVWWIRYRFNGQLVRKAIGYDRRLAEEAITAIKGDIVRGEHRLKRSGDRRLFKEMVPEYLEEKAGKRSLKRDEVSFKSLLPEFQHKLLDNISRQDIEAYMKKRRGQVSGATTNRELSLLKHMFNIAIEKGYIDQNPAKGVKRSKEAPWRHKFVFSEFEIHQLFGAAAPHLRPILAVAFGTGLRKGDILGLRWKDIDLERGIITLNMQKTEDAIEIPILPMMREVLERIKAQENGSPFVFTFHQGRKISDIKTAFRAALQRSRLAEKGYRFHDIRRTFATMLYNRGVVLTKIQRLLGHRSIITTERYLGVKFEETRQAIMALDQPLSRALTEPIMSTICAQSPERPAEIVLLSDTSETKALPS
jgi:integrase